MSKNITYRRILIKRDFSTTLWHNNTMIMLICPEDCRQAPVLACRGCGHGLSGNLQLLPPLPMVWASLGRQLPSWAEWRSAVELLSKDYVLPPQGYRWGVCWGEGGWKEGWKEYGSCQRVWDGNQCEPLTRGGKWSILMLAASTRYFGGRPL